MQIKAAEIATLARCQRFADARWKRVVININKLFVLLTSTTPANDNTENVENFPPSRFEMEKTLLAFVLITCLAGCVGAQLSVPDQKNEAVPDHRESSAKETEREWCGMTLWVGLPLPLKLPVCQSRPPPSYLYACGPFMFLGPIMHSYEGNFFCGKFL